MGSLIYRYYVFFLFLFLFLFYSNNYFFFDCVHARELQVQYCSMVYYYKYSRPKSISIQPRQHMINTLFSFNDQRSILGGACGFGAFAGFPSSPVASFFFFFFFFGVVLPSSPFVAPSSAEVPSVSA